MMNLKRTFTFGSLIALLFASNALAVNSINVQTFNPSTSDHFVILEDGFRSEWPKTSNFYFGANYNYVDAPLVALNATQTDKAYNIVDSVQTFDLFFGFKAANNLGLFLGAPIHTVAFSAGSPAFFPKGSSTVFGDMKILAKIRLTDDASNTSVALIPEFHLPTGGTSTFASDASTYIGARLALERQFDAWTMALNLGYASAANSIYADPQFSQRIDYRKRLITGIGGFFPFSDAWGMNVELNSINMIPFDSNLNPNDAYAGLRYAANDSLIFTGGASVGRIGGTGGQDLRAIAGIRYTMFDDKKQAPRPVVLTPAPTPAPTPMPTMTPAPTPAAILPMTPVMAPKIVMKEDHLEIATPSINFENNSYKLMPDSKQTLDEVAEIIKTNKNIKKVLIDGHTNNVGNDKYNLRLSLARSKEVKHYLTTRGVPAGRLEARGYGLRKPKVPTTDPRASEINRRVEFIIVK